MTKRQNTQVKKVMETLHGQKFYDFYKDGGTWDNYIANRMDNKKLKKEIQEEIKNLFNIK
jgi:translation initiation factor IF-1